MKTKQQLGKIPAKYSFILNSYNDYRASKCPNCQKNTHPRKFVLLILVKNTYSVALGFTCKYCSKCELIIAHKNDLEDQLCLTFDEIDPNNIGNDYFVAGTVDKKKWKANIGNATEFEDMLKYVSTFKSSLKLERSPVGWYSDLRLTRLFSLLCLR